MFKPILKTQIQHLEQRAIVVIPHRRRKHSAFKFSNTTYLQPQNMLKFPKDHINSFRTIVTIDQKQVNESNLSTLKRFPSVEQLLRKGLNQEVDNLPPFLWE